MLPGLRLPCLAVLLAIMPLSPLPAELTPGSSAVVTQPSKVIVAGKPSLDLYAGDTVTIIGLRSATQEAVVSYQPAGAAKIVGVISLGSIIEVDETPGQPTPAQPQNSAPAPVPASSAASTPTPAPTPLDLTKTISAVDVARYFKADKASASRQLEGQRIFISGTIAKLDVIGSPGSGDMPVLYLQTASGLPRLKISLSNNIANHDVYFRSLHGRISDWWWTYSGRSLDCRLNSLGEIQARIVFWNGSSSISSNRSAGPWFTLFKAGDPVFVEAFCKGLYMDVTFDSAYLLAREKPQAKP